VYAVTDHRNLFLTLRNRPVTVLVLPPGPKASSLGTGRGGDNEVRRPATPIRTTTVVGSLRPREFTPNHAVAQKFTGHMTGRSAGTRATLLTKE
jgi:hypothetical protein